MIKVAIWAFLGGLLPAATILLLQMYNDPIRRYKTVSKTENEEVIGAQSSRKYLKPKEKARVEDVRQSLLGIAADLYYAVKLKSKGKEVSIQRFAIVDTSVSLDTIEFSVKSLKWDELDSAEKVLILKKTFRFVREKYPDMTTIVRLTFDDGRQSLDLEFE